MGYSIEDDYLEEELEDNQYSMSARAEAADESDMYIRFKNFTGGGTKKVPDCEILGIELSRDDFDNKYDAALGNGITFGMTPDEVKAVMGEPTDSYTSDTSDYMTLTYEEMMMHTQAAWNSHSRTVCSRSSIWRITTKIVSWRNQVGRPCRDCTTC